MNIYKKRFALFLCIDTKNENFIYFETNFNAILNNDTLCNNLK